MNKIFLINKTQFSKYANAYAWEFLFDIFFSVGVFFGFLFFFLFCLGFVFFNVHTFSEY